MTLTTYLRSYVEDLKWTLEEIDQRVLDAVVEVFQSARAEGQQVLLIGNGGSAALAAHMACDLGKGTVDFRNPSFTRFRVISLSDNTALMTAIGNDLSFNDVFTEQLKIVMQPGDVVVLISASGNSPNLVAAAEFARSRGGVLVGLLGFGGGKLAQMVDHALVVSSRNYGISEDFHLIANHVLTQHLRRVLAGPPRRVAFLDRDGVINERMAPHQYVRSWDEFRFIDGARAMLRGLAALGYELIVVSNQQGVGKGEVSAGALRDIHTRMSAELASDGITLSGVFVCPHLESEGCFCRKPRPGLIHRALNETPFLIDLPGSVLIGDSPSDIEAGRAAGVGRTVMIGQGSQSVAASLVVDTVAQTVAALGAAH